MNTTIVLNFIRSANAPQISAGRDDEEHPLEEHVRQPVDRRPAGRRG